MTRELFDTILTETRDLVDTLSDESKQNFMMLEMIANRIDRMFKEIHWEQKNGELIASLFVKRALNIEWEDDNALFMYLNNGGK